MKDKKLRDYLDVNETGILCPENWVWKSDRINALYEYLGLEYHRPKTEHKPGVARKLKKSKK